MSTMSQMFLYFSVIMQTLGFNVAQSRSGEVKSRLLVLFSVEGTSRPLHSSWDAPGMKGIVTLTSKFPSFCGSSLCKYSCLRGNLSICIIYSIYDVACSMLKLSSEFFCSMRPLVTAAGAGSVSSLLVALAGDLLKQHTPTSWIPPPDICPLLPALPEPWTIDPTSLLLGILIGLLAGPVFDFLVIVRLSWARVVRARLSAPGPVRGPFHRVIG